MRRLFWPHIVLCLLLASNSNLTLGQDWSGYCKAKADSLSKSGIDTVVWYRPYNGPLTMEGTDSLLVYERQYLIWREKENLFVSQYFNYINVYNKKKGDSVLQYILRDTFDLFGYLREHFQQVVNDTLLFTKLRTVKDGKEIIWDLSPNNVSDDGYTHVIVLAAGKAHTNGYMAEQLNDGIIRNPDGSVREIWESLHYQANVNKAIHQFILRIEKEVTAFGPF